MWNSLLHCSLVIALQKKQLIEKVQKVIRSDLNLKVQGMKKH